MVESLMTRYFGDPWLAIVLVAVVFVTMLLGLVAAVLFRAVRSER